MPHILRLGQNLPDHIAAPVIRVVKFLPAFPDAHSFFAKVNGGCFHLLVKEDAGNLIRAVSFNGQAEYPADNCGGFLVDQPVVFVLRVFFVSVNSDIGGWLAGFAFHTDSGFLLAAQIP